jgi:hypothetical protein
MFGVDGGGYPYPGSARQDQSVTTIIIAYHEKGYMHEAGAKTINLPPFHCIEYCPKIRPATEMPNRSALGR